MAALIDYRGKTPKKTSFGIPLITAKVVKGGRIETPNEFIAVDDYELWMRRGIPEPGDVVITTEAPLGEVAQLGHERVALAQRLIALRGKKGLLDNSFMKFLMQSAEVQDQLRARASGTTVLGIKQSELRKIFLSLPPIKEQCAIAHILGALDDRIELNRRMNQTLEAMARALFKSWFVVFDPVRARAEGRDHDLPKPLAELFPDSFEDSELGEIPRGWEVKLLSEVCTLGRGASPRPINDYMNGEIPWVKIADATAAGGPFLFETKERLKTAGVDKSVMVSPGDLILSNSATCGVPMFVELHGCIHDGWLYFKNLRSISKLYLFHVLIELAEHLVHIADGSVQKNLNINLVGRQYVLVPPQAVVAAFDKQTTTWFTRMRDNGIESRALAALRDTLLPKLVSGELRIKDAARITVEASA
jgi:type I restriction enzyme S subunit